MKKLALAAALVAFASTGTIASAQTSTQPVSTINAKVGATVVSPPQLAETGSGINFGSVSENLSASGGKTATVYVTPVQATATVAATGTYAETASNNAALGFVGSTATLDSFQVTGTAGLSFQVSFGPAVTLGTSNLTVTRFNTSLANNTGTLPAGTGNTSANFYVGGGLTWNGTTADTAGTYTGTYTVSVNYN